MPRAGSGPRLLVLAPLRVEALALGPGLVSRIGPVTLAVHRTGMGLAKARRAAEQLSRPGPGSPRAGRPVAVAVAGLGGGLRGEHSRDLVPGDLVVADRLLDGTGHEVARLGSAPLLAGELQRCGLRARTGTIVSTDHIVTGDERVKLAGLGAEVVDMESAAVAGSPWDRPLAVLRAISDTPDVELFSPAGLGGVGKALRSLRAARPALARWAAAAATRELVLAEPRSFCAGVRRAIETVERTIELYGPPVYVRRQIVHNARVVSRLEAAGAVFVAELAEVPDGARVVFSAHGVGNSVQAEAAQRRMSTIDATCPLVTKVHNEARRFAAAGRQIVLIGQPGHDEVEGTLGIVPEMSLVTTAADVLGLDLDTTRPTAIITQTTLATDEVSGVIQAMEHRFGDLARPAASDICYASQNRQQAVRAMAPECDLVLVMGSANSSNSRRLVEVAERSGTPAHLVDSKFDLRLEWLEGARRVGITAGASAPEELVQEVIDCLAGLGPVSMPVRSAGDERVFFPLPAEVR